LHFPNERCKSFGLNPAYKGWLSRLSYNEYRGLLRDELSTGRRRLSQADKNYLKSIYDEEILAMDELIGRILDKLQQLDLAKNTMVIFASDHGEEFWEHGGFEHGHTLYHELLKVPLIIKLPGILPAGKIVGNQVSLLDVMPTVLELLGIKYDASLAGKSLLPLIRVEERGDRTAFSENLFYYMEQKAMTTGKYKLIYSPDTGDSELYDLEADPAEQKNIAAEQPEKALQLKEELLIWLRDCQTKALALHQGKKSEPVANEEVIRRLKSLGYF